MDTRNSCECEHEFILVLGGIKELTQEIEDRLFEAGCDDAMISVRQGRVLLTFSRTASSFKVAVLSAVRQISSAKVGATVLRIDDCNLVTQADIARRIGLSRQFIGQLVSGIRGGGGFPGPICHITEGAPLWRWCEVAYWLLQKQMIKEDVLKAAREVEIINCILESHAAKQETPDLFNEVLELLELPTP